MGPAVEVKNLHKSFGALQAVRGVSFSIAPGEVFSLLGPNGAGKSTTISMLCGLLQPTTGDANICGHSILTEANAARSVLGVVPQDIALYPDLSARENLVFWGKMQGLRGAGLQQRVDEVLDIIGLRDRQKDRVGKFSGGMKRRVNIGVALLHQPKVIIMDEPTVGIDPQSRRHILDNVKLLNQRGMTVLYTTHYMEEAAELSHRIGIMDEGEIIAIGTHDELIAQVGEVTRLDLRLDGEPMPLMPIWQKVTGVSKVFSEDGETHVVSVLVDDFNRVLPRLFDSSNAATIRITNVEIHEPNLETVFLHLTGRALRDN